MRVEPRKSLRIHPALALALTPLLMHVAIVKTVAARVSWPPSVDFLTKVSLVAASAVTHWTIYGGLLLTFALTLRQGREALVTTMARKLHGDISPELLSYTRHVTQAWCGFFAAQLMISVTLFLFAPLVDWSFFVNILDLPLVVFMFVAEYLFRQWYLQDPPPHSLGDIVRLIGTVRTQTGEPTGTH